MSPKVGDYGRASPLDQFDTSRASMGSTTTLGAGILDALPIPKEMLETIAAKLRLDAAPARKTSRASSTDSSTRSNSTSSARSRSNSRGSNKRGRPGRSRLDEPLPSLPGMAGLLRAGAPPMPQAPPMPEAPANLGAQLPRRAPAENASAEPAPAEPTPAGPAGQHAGQPARAAGPSRITPGALSSGADKVLSMQASWHIATPQLGSSTSLDHWGRRANTAPGPAGPAAPPAPPASRPVAPEPRTWLKAASVSPDVPSAGSGIGPGAMSPSREKRSAQMPTGREPMGCEPAGREFAGHGPRKPTPPHEPELRGLYAAGLGHGHGAACQSSPMLLPGGRPSGPAPHGATPDGTPQRQVALPATPPYTPLSVERAQRQLPGTHIPFGKPVPRGQAVPRMAYVPSGLTSHTSTQHASPAHGTAEFAFVPGSGPRLLAGGLPRASSPSAVPGAVPGAGHGAGPIPADSWRPHSPLSVPRKHTAGLGVMAGSTAPGRGGSPAPQPTPLDLARPAAPAISVPKVGAHTAHTLATGTQSPTASVVSTHSTGSSLRLPPVRFDPLSIHDHVEMGVYQIEEGNEDWGVHHWRYAGENGDEVGAFLYGLALCEGWGSDPFTVRDRETMRRYNARAPDCGRINAGDLVAATLPPCVKIAAAVERLAREYAQQGHAHAELAARYAQLLATP